MKDVDGKFSADRDLQDAQKAQAADTEFWSLENYWDTFRREMERTEPGLANCPGVLDLMFFAFHAGANQVVNAVQIAHGTDLEDMDAVITPLGRRLAGYADEHTAAMLKLAPTYPEAGMRLPRGVQTLEHLDCFHAVTGKWY